MKLRIEIDMTAESLFYSHDGSMGLRDLLCQIAHQVDPPRDKDGKLLGIDNIPLLAGSNEATVELRDPTFFEEVVGKLTISEE